MRGLRLMVGGGAIGGRKGCEGTRISGAACLFEIYVFDELSIGNFFFGYVWKQLKSVFFTCYIEDI